MTPELERTHVLGVYLHDRLAGTLTRLAGDQHLFSFEQHYVDDPGRATLSLGFKASSGGLVTRARPTLRRLPPFFANLLPEGHLRTYLAAKAGVHLEREFSLMAVLGADLSGAVVIRPMDSVKPAAQPPRPGAIRFSLAGTHLKFPAILEAAGGLTIPAQGIGGNWIVKLPSTQCPSVPENEFVMLELARAIGIQVPPLRLLPVAEIGGLPADFARLPGQALAVQRFDRTANGRRIHMEDFAQVFGQLPEDKHKGRSYANIAAVLRAETAGDATGDFLRRIVFSVLIGNGDMHLKNWALLYPDGRVPTLAPAYDYVSTLPYLREDQLALSFGGSRALHEITLDQVRRFADRAGLPMAPAWDTVRTTAELTARAWKDLPQKDLLPPELRLTIGAQIRRVAASIAAA
ncbi:type II toxin-antitoxin system HipA family toxin [Paludibaculum fermentans]|uniref:Type II toxin-antitoxin system HipA family toxin n=1 Tax=Paludibaculum fermentans TaxID=1473598 RepID=A0A7S7NRV4_PALFE|nr:type II toxin-antitoxin system HipA family toxin [Paludibaculum fermentans]QOY88094.1 type II toxin-antitoxin system HipA family toxin [Paludibaculum fermentans]